ncbi:MAG: tetratricopeptide repeat protein [Deltaproteobacteria bacterium]|nr:tetratricopeptide repeat protein [Deltaproteobacteria bacterium]
MRPVLPLCALVAAAAVMMGHALPARAAGLLEGNHPQVEQGTEAYGRGDYEVALRHYEQAQKELNESPELLYNLGNVYLKMGRTDDAKRAYEAALSRAGDSLKPRDYFNLGNALVGLDLKGDAMAAYRQALKLDPHFEPARRNLEILLRKKTPPQNQPTPGDGGTPDGGGDGGQAPDGGQSKDNPDAGSRDGGGSDADDGDGGAPDAGTQADGGQGDAGQGDGGGQSEQNGSADGGAQDAGSVDGGTSSANEPPKPEEIDQQEAERLLDALRRNEKQFLMNQKKKNSRVRKPDKPW